MPMALHPGGDPALQRLPGEEWQQQVQRDQASAVQRRPSMSLEQQAHNSGVSTMPMMLESEALQSAAGTLPPAIEVNITEACTAEGKVQRKTKPI
jgi:hypothetical protein